MAVVAACAAAVTVSLAAASSAGAHDCQCRFSGQSYPQGATVCMRGKLTQCGMYLNNSSWKVVAEACPQVGAPRAPRLAPSLDAHLASVARRR